VRVERPAGAAFMPLLNGIITDIKDPYLCGS